jgi:hypothetical protein
MAYLFNGTTQYLSTASAPSSGTPMTIACWAKQTSAGVGGPFVAAGVNGGTHRNQLGLIGGGANTTLVAAVGAATFVTVQSTLAVSNNTWNHHAGVFASATSRTAYVNGGNSATNTTNIGSQNAADTVTVGARWATTLQYKQADIAEVGIWNVALTAAEIASLARGMTCDKVRPQNLVFYAPLVRDLIDAKGGLTITNNNSATVANHPRVYA